MLPLRLIFYKMQISAVEYVHIVLISKLIAISITWLFPSRNRCVYFIIYY